ncbi:Hsp20/alpha crystallin family protein [Haloarcula pelagica]
MDRLFEQMRRSMFGEDWNDRRGHGDGVRVERIDGGLVVVADMPGFEKDEIGVRLYDDRLVIGAENDASDELGSRRRSMSETVSLPEHVDPGDVTASYRNGVLEVRLTFENDTHEGTEIEIGE